MSTFTAKTFDCPELVLEPQHEQAFLEVIENVANDAQKRRLVPEIKSSILSIRHKMSVVMYQTALICKANAHDFQLFLSFAERNDIPSGLSSTIQYKGCIYNIENFYHYRLMMSSFVETFAAANFSLFDVCGRLLNDLYDLGRTAERTSFKKAYEDLERIKGANPDPVFSMIGRYYLPGNHPQTPSWLQPLEEIRNQTTHRPITDICTIDSQGTFYPELRSSEAFFFLADHLSPTPSQRVRLCDFAVAVFDGVQNFTETLYDLLRQALEREGSLPLS